MSMTKRLMDHLDEQAREATSIAIEAGVLTCCELHPEMVYETYGDSAAAYKIANARYTAGELRTDFASRQELTDAIKSAIDNAGGDGCTRCEKMLSD